MLEALETRPRVHARSRSRRRGGDEDGELDPLESLGTEEPRYEISEDRAVLAPGFRVLDERERRILHLRFFEGLTQSQIAQQVGISQMHVSRLIRRSLEKIRDEIAVEEDEERRSRPAARARGPGAVLSRSRSASATAGVKPIEANRSRALRSGSSAPGRPCACRQRPCPSNA